ncbi:MAG: efflux RND transporter permease subunit, partial [Candidatus Heimdallarchaeota archaeon]|nr:efflux RND transporter permease subunit [Candidatus Heimdallarchaeota archaeon]
MQITKVITSIIISILVAVVLTKLWMPLGYDEPFNKNLSFVIVIIAFVLGLFRLFQVMYVPLLRFFLRNKLIFYVLPLLVIIFGAYVWLGPESVLGKLPSIEDIEKVKLDNVYSLTTIEKFKEKVAKSDNVTANTLSARLNRQLKKDWKGRKKEFMPTLDEGSFLFMPTTMVHASLGEALDIIQKQDIAIKAIPEVESVVGKIGRVESALDPAPISMIETVINYKPEYGPVDPISGKRERLWRKNIQSPDDIWREIVNAAKIPGTTSAPKLQPIATRIVMLQSGMRAPIGVKVYGPSLEIVEKTGLEIEKYLRKVESVNSATVNAERIVGKPYLEIHIDRKAIARYGVSIN